MRKFRLVLGYSILLIASVTKAQTNTVYFLVATVWDCRPCGSYVLPLSKPEDIAQAKQLILATPTNGNGKIVSARIAAGIAYVSERTKSKYALIGSR